MRSPGRLSKVDEAANMPYSITREAGWHMQLTLLKSKIHRARVTQAELDYVGSITIDAALLTASGMLEYEKVLVVNCNNGQRFETYTIAGEADTGIVCLNGAAARLASPGDVVIIMAWASLDAQDATSHKPTVVLVDEHNRITAVSHYEKHGRLKSSGSPT